MKNVYIAFVVILLVVGVSTHFIDAAYYHHQSDKIVSQDVLKEAHLGVDFSTALGLTSPQQVDCSQFTEPSDVSYCNAINEVRK
jgi:hypothetical protein